MHGWGDAHLDGLRLGVQAVIAAAVLGGATFLANNGILEAEAVVALYGSALGAVGAGAVGGIRQNRQNGNGGK